MNMKSMRCPCDYPEAVAEPLETRRRGDNKKYADCCGRYLDNGETAPTAEALMRSRYTAYAMGREDYLLATWCPSTRPSSLNLQNEPQKKWLRLEVKRHEKIKSDHAVVEFVAHYKVDGRTYRLHEVSRFVYKTEQWFYMDGNIS